MSMYARYSLDSTVLRKMGVFHMLFLNFRGKTCSRPGTRSLCKSPGVRRLFSKALSAKAKEVIWAIGQ